MNGYQFDLHSALEVATYLGGLLGHALFLSNRIQRIEDATATNGRDLSKHLVENREDFTRVYDKLDAKADKSALRTPA